MPIAKPDAWLAVAGTESWQVIGALDERGVFTHASADASALFGLGTGTPVGYALADLLPPSEERRVLDAFASGDAQPIRHVSLEASERSVDLRLSRLRGPASDRLTVLEMRDATAQPMSAESSELVPAVDRLRQQTADMQALLRAMPDLFFRFDAEGRFLDFNAPPGSELYAPPDAFLGKHAREVMPPLLAGMMEKARAQVHATGTLATFEYDLELSGMLRQFEARYVPFVDGQTFAIVRDITARRQAARALRESEARLLESQKLDAVGRLAGGVAHDFNNLLMIILSYATTSERRLVAGDPARTAIEEIRKAGQRATALTRQLLALSGRQPTRPAVLDAAQILTEMASMLARVIGENIALSTYVEPGLAHVKADRSQIEQVLLNLVLNARDAMPKGGTLHVSAENVRRLQTPASGDEAAVTHVAFSVRDTGAGMDAATCARMFEPFFTTKERGTGLGLYVVKHIANEAQGTLDVKSHPGDGTLVTLTLPAAEALGERVGVEQAGAMPGGNEIVLVVEDEDAVRSLLVDLLRSLGYRVISASNAAEALERTEDMREGLDLLLTDVVMPGLSGYELATKIAAAHANCRILYMSGHALGGDHQQLAQLLHKPFPPEVLAKRIREVLDADD